MFTVPNKAGTKLLSKPQLSGKSMSSSCFFFFFGQNLYLSFRSNSLRLLHESTNPRDKHSGVFLKPFLWARVNRPRPNVLSWHDMHAHFHAGSRGWVLHARIKRHICGTQALINACVEFDRQGLSLWYVCITVFSLQGHLLSTIYTGHAAADVMEDAERQEGSNEVV